MEATCTKCGRRGHAYVPKGGDGSLWLMRSHKCNDTGSARSVANLESADRKVGP